LITVSVKKRVSVPPALLAVMVSVYVPAVPSAGEPPRTPVAGVKVTPDGMPGDRERRRGRPGRR